MTPDEHQRGLLLEQQARLRARVVTLETELDALTQERRGEFDDDEHDPEGATLSSQWSMAAGLLESARAHARQADDAVRRLDSGEYGICVACANPIPLAQLEARPLRERCVACST
ncbi:TraR/DksA family transcriptional regulator [Demequina sp. SO4-18]|uniref:TraR/DksA family transcriptional regulator n=1 Tax=Demequina sp. SO4-18 TaxID=3401026 RepID=UPI003B5BF005